MKKKKLLLVLAGIVFPLLLLAGVELLLRLAGNSPPNALFLPARIGTEPDGQDVWRANYLAARRFFPGWLARKPLPEVFPRQKGETVFRVFVLGESAARGESLADFSMSRFLRVMLATACPETRFEIINTGIPAINSWVSLEFARELVRYQPDAFIYYGGHNEVVGPFGPGTAFARFRSRPAVKLALRLAKWETTGLVRALADSVGFSGVFGLSGSAPEQWGGLAMFQKNRVVVSDERLPVCAGFFGANLREMVRLAETHRIGMVCCAPAVNERSFPPFASEHRPGLSASDQADWDKRFHDGAASLMANDLPAAGLSLEAAGKIDDTPSRLAFLRGQVALALGNDEAARGFLRRAVELDSLRFRLTAVFRRQLTGIAEEFTAKPWFRWVDVHEHLANMSPAGLPGREFLYDHVHLTVAGHYQAAAAIFRALRTLPGFPAPPTPPVPPAANGPHSVPSYDECVKRLGFTWREARQDLSEIAAAVARPPFTALWNHDAYLREFRTGVASLPVETDTSALEQAIGTYLVALQTGGEDPRIRARLAQARFELPDREQAFQDFAGSLALNPFDIDVLNNRGLCRLRAGMPVEAEADFQRAVAVAPNFARGFFHLGVCAARARQFDAARGWYQKSLTIDPGFVQALINLGNLHFQENRIPEALTAYEEALRRDALSAEAHYNCGNARHKLGEVARAREHYQAAATADPGFARAHFALGKLLTAAGDPQAGLEAMRRAGSAAAADPPLLRQLAWFFVMEETPGIRDDEFALVLLDKAEKQLGAIDAELWQIRGVALASLGRIQESLTCLNRAKTQALAGNDQRRAREIADLLAQLAAGQ